ncbi:ABC transporter permease subunit [Candidatus Poribacteria bacterium]|nr:ABC transporter permease subunit [Candidatus Poribacteria bacterium]
MLTLIRRELLDNLMTFRFAAAVFIMLLLVVSNTVVLIKDYERRLADYNTAVKTHHQQLQEKKTYSAGRLHVDRPPNPLSIFNIGMDKQLGNQVEVYFGFVPTLWDAKMHGSDNPIMNIFSSIDIAFIFKVVLSLLALIFAYDTLAGEREQGTLRLVLTHPVRRGHILFAKYMSAMVCLLVPLLMSVLLAVILLTTSTSISLSTDDFLRMAGFILTTIVYLSVFYLIGMLISALTRRTGTALMLSMFVWGFWVLIYPNMILASILPQPTVEARASSTFNQIEQLWEEFEREQEQYLKNDAVPGEDPGFGIGWVGGSMNRLNKDAATLQYYYKKGFNITEIDERSEPQMPHIQNYYQFLVPLTIDIADRTWRIRKPALEKIYVRPALIDRILLKVSPIGMYDTATQAWVGTDLLGIQDFFSAARQYRKTVIDFFYDKNAFASRQWIAADKGAADWSTLPQFSFQRSGIRINATRALPDIFLLLMTNIVLFIIIFLIFIKTEV